MLFQMQINKIQEGRSFSKITRQETQYRNHKCNVRFCLWGVYCLAVICKYWKSCPLTFYKMKLNPSYDQRNLSKSPCSKLGGQKLAFASVTVLSLGKTSLPLRLFLSNFLVKAMKRLHCGHVHLTSCTHTAAQHCLYTFWVY